MYVELDSFYILVHRENLEPYKGFCVYVNNMSMYCMCLCGNAAVKKATDYMTSLKSEMKTIMRYTDEN